MAELVVTERFVLFWNGWPSQWHPAPITIDGMPYSCTEQFMMAEKARVFGDRETEAAIMAADHPRKQKSLGRQVRGFDPERWNSVCRGIVYRGNLAKFTQLTDLRAALLETGDRVIVEASPLDRVWGIGLAQDDPRALDPSQWQGTNWLGIAIMQVRDLLLRDVGREAPPPDPDLLAQLALRETMQRAGRVE